MDDVTRALRNQYEEFPYPPVAEPEQRIGWDVDLLLSYGRRRPSSAIRTALDAGCGRGGGILGAAALQPHVQFVGADINRVALAEAQAQAEARGITNVRFEEVDLTTLEGLMVPDGGFDAVFSSGVVHHMPDPARGLEQLRRVLAPHGMIQLMVYGSRGREPLYRMVRALDHLLPRSFSLRDRLVVARQLASSLLTDAAMTGPWNDLRTIDDTELVDRYLNVNERSYDVPQLFDLVDGAGLRFLRWTEPGEWDLAAIVRDGPLRELADRLPDRERFALIDELAWRPKLELIACRDDNEARPAPTAAQIATMTLAVSPEVSFHTEVRNVRAGQRVEHLSLRLRANRPLPVENGLIASALLYLKDASAPFVGRDLLCVLGRNGVPLEDAQELVCELVSAEILYVRD